MSSCLSWGYFLKKLGINRQSSRPTVVIADNSIKSELRQMEDFQDQIPSPIRVQQLRENNIYHVSLLHPDWRRFPHVPLYGWTNDHEKQLKNLNNMIVNGSLESAYYNSEIEYRAARFVNYFAILNGPNISDVNEAILLLRRHQSFQYNSCCHESTVEYDADDESETNPTSLRRYYNHNKPRRNVIGQQTAF